MKPGSLITTRWPATIWDVDYNSPKSSSIGTTTIVDICMVIKENEYEILVLCQNVIIGWITKLHVNEMC